MGEGNAHQFTHEAMAAPFRLRIADETATYAQQAGDAAFAEIDLTEAALSRFRESSDISQINQAGKGVPVRVGERAFACLEAAARVHTDTNGAFDVTIGPLLRCWRNEDKSLRRPSKAELAAARRCVGMGLVKLDPQAFTVCLEADGMLIDLGGIGKGFALDRAAEVLGDWGITSALLDGGGSTVLALDPPRGQAGWPVHVGGVGKDAPSPGTILLRHGALSGSGTQVKGRHIVDPRTGRPAAGRVATWAACPGGAVADALSTALMVLSPAEAAAYVDGHPDTCVLMLVERRGGRLRLRYGDWEGRLGLVFSEGRPRAGGTAG